MTEMPSVSAPTRKPLDFAWRALVVALGYTLAAMIGGAVIGALGLPLPDIGTGPGVTERLLLALVSGALMAVVLGPLAARLTLPRGQRVALLFGMVFVLGELINIIEALFYTAVAPIVYVSGLIVPLVGLSALAVLLGWLFPPATVEGGLWAALRETFARRRWPAWVWRIVLAGLLYVPTYVFFGALVSPIVTPYYQDPSLGLNLTLPDFGTVLLVQVGRGPLFVLTLLPLVAVLRTSRWRLAPWLWLTIAVLGSWVPMLQLTEWPATLRVAHGLEITGDAFVQGLTIAWLLGRGSDRAA
jgi:hypothetical protein